MRTSWFSGPGLVSVVEVDDPVILDARDAVVDIDYAAICGSDLWAYRGLVPKAPGSTGHEFIGRVREVGHAVTGFAPGDSVIAPFVYSEGSCAECRRGLQPFCAEAGLWGKDGPGAQAERIRVPFADATLVGLPWAADEIDVTLARKLLPLADVYATGTHGAALAEVGVGDTVAVIGDGAVGIAAASAARARGAGRVVLLGEQDSRLQIASGFGVETLKVQRDEPAAERFLDLNGGVRADCVIECVGLQASFDTAIDLVRPGGRLGFVGVPHGVAALPPMTVFNRGMHLAGGTAPARHYLPRLVSDVREGRLDPSPLIDTVHPLDAVAQGFDDMHSGRALKVLLTIRPQPVRRVDVLSSNHGGG
ncbi:alcohol dehydrogenase catalytic domain-containing protein [Herbiconiux daphne]|uniref:Alcohol dehydrogenase catalytic domain-containing protein n=1 Tax=Herbiconiux daphne TaxID=2970914 RepID=A0ABT2H3K0_9MICO|nr:alcohol dehydrogenase catalytic domain-containing protein [Herbiconiux daphne]MCS5734511.1 alcohol dehydrogenase catalytic domain-containing protein [Herbiconiux daphne]